MQIQKSPASLASNAGRGLEDPILGGVGGGFIRKLAIGNWQLASY